MSSAYKASLLNKFPNLIPEISEWDLIATASQARINRNCDRLQLNIHDKAGKDQKVIG